MAKEMSGITSSSLVFACPVCGEALLEFPVAQPIVHFEHHRSSMFLPDQRDIEEMRKAARAVQEIAMSPEATSELIATIIEEMEHTE
ncbi:MAG: Scr1 family TA system antitoxin-like transcriptional regulator [Sciscionella sp.]